MKNKFLMAVLCIGLLTIYFACEKDDSVVKEEQVLDSPTSQIIPTIKTVAFDEAGETFNRLTNAYQLGGFLDSSIESNVFSRSTLDTLGITIYTDNIKEVTAGDYTSYTMLIATPNTTDSKFYNLTIEDKNGEAGMFVTKYIPTENWLSNKDQVFEGSMSAQRVDNFTTVGIDDGGGTNDDDYPNTNPPGSLYYPTDCNGYVYVTIESIPYQCSCEGHWPWENCHCVETGGDNDPGYNDIPYYQCIEADEGSNPGGPDDSNNSNPGGGEVSDDAPNNGDGSIGGFVSNEDVPCENPPPGDLNGDCVVNIKDCVLAGNNPEVCHCIFNGGTEEECDKDCKQLKYSISDHPTIKTRLNQMRLASGNYEKGLRVDKRPTTDEYEPTPILENSGGNHINIIVNPYTAVIAHTHPIDVFYKMFSAEDVLKMAQIAKKIQSVQSISASTVEFTEITHILIFENSPGQYRTYALRFDDIESVQALLGILNNKSKQKKFLRKLKDAYQSDHNYQTALPETDIFKQQRHLFKFLEANNLNISLYEANFDGNGQIDNWAKINKETLEQDPCD